MSSPYSLIVFDWEGTLGDTLGQILQTVAVVAKGMGFGDLDEQLARESVVLGLVLAIKKLFPDLSMHQHEQLLAEVQQALVTHSANSCLIPGAKRFLQDLKQTGLTLAIATNKGQHSLQRALVSAGIDDLFTVTRSAGQVPAKPCPQMIEEIMDVCGATPSQTLMIGDSISDVEMALQAGVDVIGVDFYHQQAASLLAAGAMDVFDDYQQVAQFLSLASD